MSPFHVRQQFGKMIGNIGNSSKRGSSRVATTCHGRVGKKNIGSKKKKNYVGQNALDTMKNFVLI